MKNNRHNALYRSIVLALTVAAAAFLGAGAALAASGPEMMVGLPKVPDAAVARTLDEMLYDYSVFNLDTAAIERQVRAEGRLVLHLGNRVFDLALELNDIRSPGYREVLMIDGVAVEQKPSPVTTWRGHVDGDLTSIVRLNVLADRFEGYVKTAEDWFYVDPLVDYDRSLAAGDVVVYRDQDVRPASAGDCGTGRLHRVAQEVGGRSFAPAPAANDGNGDGILASNLLQVANECDGEYYADYGNPGSFNRMNAVMSAVDGIYESEIDTDVSVVAGQCWTNAGTDPYTSTNASTTLNQFRSYWNSNMGGTSRDVAHLFSGKDFSGSTIGIAWVGVICNAPSYAYGAVQDLSSTVQRRRVSAHEMGHNLSATHDNQAPVCPGVSCSGSGPLMCASIQTSTGAASDDFSNCSRNDIDDHISSFGSCL